MYGCSLKAGVAVTVVVLLMVFYAVLREPDVVNFLRLTANKDGHAQFSCLSQVVTVQPGGRLGNILMEYASVWSLARLNKLRMAMPRGVLEPLESVYEKLNVQSLEDLLEEPPCQTSNLTEAQVLEIYTEDIYRAIQRKELVVIKKYSVNVHAIFTNLEELRGQFKFRLEIANKASHTLSDIRDQMAQRGGTQDSKVLVVSIHVRRTDYFEYLQNVTQVRHFADVGYYRKAAARMRQLLQTEAKAIAFVILSDDRGWCEKELLPQLLQDFQEGSPASGAFLAPEEVTSRDHDMAVLSMANHSIYAYGTFGTWGALMAGGRGIVFDLQSANPNAQPPATTIAMGFAQLMKWEILW